MFSTDSIIKEIINLNPSHIIIGYSGGIDSSVILNVLSQIQSIPITAIHINHNINIDSNNWQIHCNEVCESLNINFISHKLGTCPKGESFEAWASNQRMNYFIDFTSEMDNPILILGHHQDDQAETFLIQAIRGSGLAGLSAMPRLKKLNNLTIFRTMLDISRENIEKYANSNSLQYIHDDSNDDIVYKRNYIRHKIIPLLK